MSDFSKKEKTKNDVQQPLTLNLRSILKWFILLIIAIFCLPWLLTSYSFWSIDFSETGDVGDTIGGITGPFIAIIAAGLTFLAFRVQYEANEQQKIDLKIERFESKFYEMLSTHRTNVEAISIGNNLKGRVVFSHLFDELAFYYNIMNAFYTNRLKSEQINAADDETNLMKYVYRLFIYGFNDYSNKQLNHVSNPRELGLLNRSRYYIEHIQDIYKAKTNIEDFIEFDIEKDLKEYWKSSQLKDSDMLIGSITFFYKPFKGHFDTLSHYYSYLFHTASFVTQNNDLTDDEKQDYINLLRAELSPYEQMLLYYYSIGFSSENWDDLFIKYGLIKNLPIPLADFGEKPDEKYATQIAEELAKGKTVFEQRRQPITSSPPTP